MSRCCLLFASLVFCQLVLGTRGFEVTTKDGTFLALKDARTGTLAHTLFLEEATDAIVDGIKWDGVASSNSTEVLNYKTFVNGEIIHQGFVALPEDPLKLPDAVYAGTIVATKGGQTDIEVQFWVGDKVASVSVQVQAFKKWKASIPMILIFLIGTMTNFHVIYNLLLGLLVGGCIVTGSFINGFKEIVSAHILEVVSETQHIYLYTFTIGVAGLVAMIRKSGGIAAVAKHVGVYSYTQRIAQFFVFAVGVVVFFDANASILLVGELLSPFFRLFPVSVEKFAFLIDSTALPIAAFNPLSTWVGFNSVLIQGQLDRLDELGYHELSVPDNGWAVFRKSLKYQFYSVFTLFLVTLLVGTQRDFGPMLIAERRRWIFTSSGHVSTWTLREKISRPEDDTPRKAYNMLFPVLFWIVSIWIAFGFVNDPDAEDNATEFLEALIYCTVGTAAISQLFFVLQGKINGEITFTPTHFFGKLFAEHDEEGQKIEVSSVGPIKSRNEVDDKSIGLKSRMTTEAMNAEYILKNLQALSSVDMENESKLNTLEPPTDGNEHTKLMVQRITEDIEASFTPKTRVQVQNVENEQVTHVASVATEPRALVSLQEGAECFLKGSATVTPMLVTLTLAWATTELFLKLGMDRLFSDLINRGNLRLEAYPAVTFTISLLMTLATGSSTAASTILLPLVAVPIYVGSDGDAELFYAVVGAVFSGAVAGAHASPLSESTILSSFAIDCGLKSHIRTQSPYIVFVILVSVIIGVIPSAFTWFPYYVAYIIGFIVLALFVRFVCQEVLHEEGKYDLLTESYLSRVIDPDLQDLKTQMCVAHGMHMARMSAREKDEDPDTDSVSKVRSSDDEVGVSGSSSSDDESGESDDSSDDDGDENGGEVSADDDDDDYEEEDVVGDETATGFETFTTHRTASQKTLKQRLSSFRGGSPTRRTRNASSAASVRSKDVSAAGSKRSNRSSKRHGLEEHHVHGSSDPPPNAASNFRYGPGATPRQILDGHTMSVAGKLIRPPGRRLIPAESSGELIVNSIIDLSSTGPMRSAEEDGYDTTTIASRDEGDTAFDDATLATGLGTRVLRWFGNR